MRGISRTDHGRGPAGALLRIMGDVEDISALERGHRRGVAADEIAQLGLEHLVDAR